MPLLGDSISLTSQGPRGTRREQLSLPSPEAGRSPRVECVPGQELGRSGCLGSHCGFRGGSRWSLGPPEAHLSSVNTAERTPVMAATPRLGESCWSYQHIYDSTLSSQAGLGQGEAKHSPLSCPPCTCTSLTVGPPASPEHRIPGPHQKGEVKSQTGADSVGGCAL